MDIKEVETRANLLDKRYQIMNSAILKIAELSELIWIIDIEKTDPDMKFVWSITNESINALFNMVGYQQSKFMHKHKDADTNILRAAVSLSTIKTLFDKLDEKPKDA
jgi:hypothetical protein